MYVYFITGLVQYFDISTVSLNGNVVILKKL